MEQSRSRREITFSALLVAAVLFTLPPVVVRAQGTPAILGPSERVRIVPAGFYFEGQSAPTQVRNASAARFGERRHLIAALVDTSGYSSDIRAKYEGFLISDLAVTMGGAELPVGAYGFGFTDDGKFNVFDVSGTRVLSVDANQDPAMRRPRPLMMIRSGDELRLYSGRTYVTVAAR